MKSRLGLADLNPRRALATQKLLMDVERIPEVVAFV